MLKAICNYSTPLARDIVKATLAPHPEIGLRTQDIYKAAIEKFPDATQPVPATNFLLREQRRRDAGLVQEPEQREHPIRSMRYLKKIILDDLLERGDVEKVRIARARPDTNGNRPDTITSKLTGRIVKLNVAINQLEWRWRLVERQDNNEDIVTKVIKLSGKKPGKKPGFGLRR